MNWQIKYALEHFKGEPKVSTAEHVRNDTIRIFTPNQPDVLAVLSTAETLSSEIAHQYHAEEPEMDFLCGFRTECVWEGQAIEYLENNQIGWGRAGTLYSAASNGNANNAQHKDFAFSDRLIKQYSLIVELEREYDRIYRLTLKNDRSFRIGMLADYEPTADAVRTLWQRFGPVDVIWNVNPNGNPTGRAIQAGAELGCEVIKWEEFKVYMRTLSKR